MSVTVEQLIHADEQLRADHALSLAGADFATRMRGQRGMVRSSRVFWELVQSADESTITAWQATR